MALLALAIGQRGDRHPQPVATPEGSAPHAAPTVQAAPVNPTLAQRAMQFAESMVAPQPGNASASQPSIPKELTEDAQTLLDSSRSQDRRRAASNILRYKPAAQVVPYLRASAQLEQARSCRERKDAITDISELKDPRALPALRRLADAGRTGCGFLGFKDCYGCIRTDLRRALDLLEPPRPLEP
jgi:hypothetical protein